MISLKNKNIFIAGGSGYLGSVLCEEILKLEGNIFLTDQDIKRSELVIKKLQKKYPKSKIIFSHLNMIEPESISKNIKLAYQKFKYIDGLVNATFGSLQDPLKKFGIKSKEERRKIIGDLLEAVNMRREYMDRYPHEFSGGQRQRIGIVRALCLEPELIVCDEAVSALDVSIQAQVLQLLMQLKNEKSLTYLFITHDLSVTEYLCDRIAVMYLGRIVELCDSEDLYNNTLHPYSEALISAIPVADLDKKTKRIVLEGDVPSPVNPPKGCPFHPRCPKAKDICKTEVPKLKKYSTNGKEHYASCHLIDLPERS